MRVGVAFPAGSPDQARFLSFPRTPSCPNALPAADSTSDVGLCRVTSISCVAGVGHRLREVFPGDTNVARRLHASRSREASRWNEKIYKTCAMHGAAPQDSSAPADLTREQETTMSTKEQETISFDCQDPRPRRGRPEGRRGGPLDDPGPIRGRTARPPRAPETRSAGCAGALDTTAPQRLLQGLARPRPRPRLRRPGAAPPTTTRCSPGSSPWRSPPSRWSTRRSAPTRSGTSARRPARWR